MLRRRDEQGAVAVIYAIVVMLLLGVSALAVDLGNTVARRTATQSQADFAALAGAAELEATPVQGGTPSTEVVESVRDYLNSNQPQDDERACWRTAPPTCVTSAHLTDGAEANGEVRYTADGLEVVAPRVRVDFGFAGVFGAEGTYVGGAATVTVKTGGVRVMPAFAVQGCDFGRQTLTDPANGPVDSGVPPLAFNTHTNGTNLSALGLRDAIGTTVTELQPGSSGNLLTLQASNWENSRYLGFFRSDNADPALVLSQQHFWSQGDATRTDLSPGTSGYTPGAPNANGSRSVEALIPDLVTATNGVWYVRVFNGTDAAGRWSPADEALPLRVGGAVLECAAGSVEGNFGTLRLPRTVPSNTAEHLPANIALGVQRPITPTVHAWAVANPASAGACQHSVNGAVVSWGSYLRAGTNCVGTDPGVSAHVATKGLVTGGTGYSGLLTTQLTRTGCDPTGGSASRTVTVQPRDYALNDEVLTCYLSNGTTSLADIARRDYSGGPVLDAAVFSSPRFLWVPVLALDPGTGAQAQDAGYSIIDFRPGFITDEPASPTAVRNSHQATTENGLTVSNNGVTQIKIFFFNQAALPRDGDFPVIDFLGVGDPVIRMVD